MGYKCKVPQRDGIELFIDWQMNVVTEYFPDATDRCNALAWMIYLVDLGDFLG